MFTAKSEIIIILYIPACKRVYQRRIKMHNVIHTGNLYKIWSNNDVVAFITAQSEEKALTIYKEKGKALVVTAEKISFGSPEKIEKIYS